MHIKQIRIAGFKSYRELEGLSLPFSPHHNVIVGRNGAGKSNFFWAIRFVLLDAYSNPTNDERVSILHDASNIGPNAAPAYVELVFDNTGEICFPTGKDETILRRVIGVKKDEFILDKKIATKSEILNLLQAAGFSTSNPYYIVPQGRVTALCNFRDADRLVLLKEIAGITQYEHTRHIALRKMEEISAKRTNISNLMSQISTRLEALDGEKTLLAKYTELEHERKCLEFALHDRELNAAKNEMESADEMRAGVSANASSILDSLSESRSLAADCAESIRQLDSKLKIELRATYEECQRELSRLSESRVAILLSLRELGVDAEKSHNGRLNSETAADAAAATAKLLQIDEMIADVRQSISSIESRIAELKPRCARLAESEKSLSATLSVAENRLRLSTNSSDNYKGALNAKDRAKIQDIVKDLVKTKREIIAQIEENNLILHDLNEKVAGAQAAARSESSELQSAKERKREAEKMRDALAEERKAQWRLQAASDGKLSAAQETISRLERIVFAGMDRAAARGLQTLQNVISQYGITGVYGPLFELINVNAVFRTAVEVVAGSSLFSVIVADDVVASNVLDAMKKYKLELTTSNSPELIEKAKGGVGKITLIPLNRISHTDSSSRIPQNDSNVIPMLSKIEYDGKFEPAMRQIFGGAAICSDLNVASRVSRDCEITTVTLQGDRIDRRGALTGGYIAPRHVKGASALPTASSDLHKISTGSRLECIIAYRSALTSREQLKKTIAEAKNSVIELNHKITIELSKIQKAKEVIRRYGPASEGTGSSTLDSQKEYHALRRRQEVAQGDHAKLTSRLETIEAELGKYQEQLNLSSTDSEHQLIGAFASTSLYSSNKNRNHDLGTSETELANCVATTKTQLQDIKSRRAAAEFELHECENKLHNVLVARELDLIRQKLELEAVGTGDSLDGAGNEISNASGRAEELMLELMRNNEQRAQAENEIEQIEQEIERIKEQLNKLKSEKEMAQLNTQKLSGAVENEERENQSFMQRRRILKERIDGAQQQIQELGVLPDDYTKYIKSETLVIERILLRIKSELQGYDGRVNKKAFEQCSTFSKEKEKLVEKCLTLEAEDEAIRKLIVKLDRSKVTVLESSFKKIAENFANIWKRLVQDGRGELYLISKGGKETSSEEIDISNQHQISDDSEDSSSSTDEDANSDNESSRTRSRKKITKIKPKSKKTKIGAEKYEGISIKVSFTKHGARTGGRNAAKSTSQDLELSQLSGGQKSLVALCLIFAIQICTPAPFYLFDEIDANLDAQYRTSVAQLVYELSRNAQFITTTFRPELLARADSYYGVTFGSKSSMIHPVEREEAMGFIEQAQEEVQVETAI